VELPGLSFVCFALELQMEGLWGVVGNQFFDNLPPFQLEPIEKTSSRHVANLARCSGDQQAAAAPWPKKLADRIGAIRDLVTKAPAAWSVEQVAGAFRSANKADVAKVLDGLTALGILAGYEAGGGRRWKLTRATA